MPTKKLSDKDMKAMEAKRKREHLDDDDHVNSIAQRVKKKHDEKLSNAMQEGYEYFRNQYTKAKAENEELHENMDWLEADAADARDELKRAQEELESIRKDYEICDHMRRDQKMVLDELSKACEQHRETIASLHKRHKVDRDHYLRLEGASAKRLHDMRKRLAAKSTLLFNLMVEKDSETLKGLSNFNWNIPEPLFQGLIFKGAAAVIASIMGNGLPTSDMRSLLKSCCYISMSSFAKVYSNLDSKVLLHLAREFQDNPPKVMEPSTIPVFDTHETPIDLITSMTVYMGKLKWFYPCQYYAINDEMTDGLGVTSSLPFQGAFGDGALFAHLEDDVLEMAEFRHGFKHISIMHDREKKRLDWVYEKAVIGARQRMEVVEYQHDRRETDTVYLDDIFRAVASKVGRCHANKAKDQYLPSMLMRLRLFGSETSPEGMSKKDMDHNWWTTGHELMPEIDRYLLAGMHEKTVVPIHLRYFVDEIVDEVQSWFDKGTPFSDNLVQRFEEEAADLKLEEETVMELSAFLRNNVSLKSSLFRKLSMLQKKAGLRIEQVYAETQTMLCDMVSIQSRLTNVKFAMKKLIRKIVQQPSSSTASLVEAHGDVIGTLRDIMDVIDEKSPFCERSNLVHWKLDKNDTFSLSHNAHSPGKGTIASTSSRLVQEPVLDSDGNPVMRRVMNPNQADGQPRTIMQPMHTFRTPDHLIVSDERSEEISVTAAPAPTGGGGGELETFDMILQHVAEIISDNSM